MQRSVPAVLFLLFVALSTPSAAAAQDGDDEARRHFRLAEAHYANGSFEEAAREFEEAYRLSQRPQLLYNLYLAYRDAADLERAADALRRYLALVPDAEGASMLRGRLAALERTIAERPAVESSTSGTGAGGAAGSGRTEGAAGRPETESAAGGGSSATSSSATSTAGATGAPSTASAGTTSGGEASPVPWIVGGVGVAIVIAGAVTGGLALAAQGDLESTCPDRACPAGYDFEGQASTGRTLAITTDVLLVTGAVAVGTGIVLLAVMGTGSSETPPATAGLACDGAGCAVAVRGRF